MILAAGIGSRFGGVKQIEPVGEHGELIIDYSIYDAISAGFNKVVFIIRRAIEKDFCDKIFNRIKSQIDTEYVFQDLDDLPCGFTAPKDRTKPWGTAHAILAARHVIDGPFCVINADDFYGRDAFEKIAEFLKYGEGCASVNYKLFNTLSDTGSVSRGICSVDENGMITQIKERTQIERCGHKVGYLENDTFNELCPNSDVAVNFFGFQPEIMPLLYQKFGDFLKAHINNPKAEYQSTTTLNAFIKDNKITMKNFSSTDTWLGFTYPEDKAKVMNEIRNLTANGTYPSPLWQEKEGVIKISLEKPVFSAYNRV